MIGFRTRNNNSVLVIDGTYKNLELISSGSVSLGTADPNNQGMYADVAVPLGSTNVLLAIRSAAQGVYWKKLNASTFRIYAGGSTAVTVAYYLFADPVQSSNVGKVGLVIRNASNGQVLYKSTRKYLRVLGMLSGTIVTDSTVTQQYAGKTVAIIQMLRANLIRMETGGTGQQPIFVVTWKSATMHTPDASTVRITHRTVATNTGFGNPSPYVDAIQEYAYMIVDVSNI
jgi:hypothetical protein